MKKLILIILLLPFLFAQPRAMEFTAPQVPESGREYMDESPETFGEGLLHIISKALPKIQPALAEAAKACVGVIAAVFVLTIGATFHADTVQRLVGAIVVAAMLLTPSRSLISLAADTVKQLSDYGKLLLPVMASAMAAQGSVTASSALYAGTAFFNSVLSSIISGLVVPLLYVYICFCVAQAAIGDESLQKLRDFAKWLMTWLLKTTLYVFTGYLTITGAVSGSVDAAAMKATKLTISGMVPVVGGILSDASETVLVSAGILKNAAGVYGALAVLSVCIGPFLQIGAQYLLLKLTHAVCSAFGAKEPVKLIGDFSGVMGVLLGMTGTVSLLLLVSTVCMIRGGGL